MQKPSQQRRGFTIIEVVLFLAITGLMLAGILTAVGAGVNAKRYTEAVDSFHDFLISQFDQVDNVANTANASGVTSSNVRCNTDAPKPAGTTSCSIVGRLVTSSNGLVVEATPIYAGKDVTEISRQDITTPADLLSQLNLYTVNDSPDSQAYDMRWQTNLRARDGSGAQSFTMMIIRLPYAQGSISYVTSGVNQQIGNLITQVTANGASQQLVLCVDPAGLQAAAPVGIVVENAGNGGASSIQRKGSVCQ